MELDKGKKILISVMLILTSAMVIGTITYFTWNGKKVEEPPSKNTSTDSISSIPSVSSGGGSSSEGFYIEGNPRDSPPDRLPPLRNDVAKTANVDSTGPGIVLLEYLGKCKGNTDGKGKDISAIKPALEKISAMECADPLDDGSAGYLALFTLLYPFLKDKKSSEYEEFFIVDDYDKIITDKKLLKTVKDDIFSVLKSNLSKHANVSDYLNENYDLVSMAFKFILLRRIYNLRGAAVDVIIDSMPYLDISFNAEAGKLKNNKVKRKKYLDIVLREIINSDNKSNLCKAFWLSKTKLAIFGYIFKFKPWVTTFKSRINPSNTGITGGAGGAGGTGYPANCFNPANPGYPVNLANPDYLGIAGGAGGVGVAINNDKKVEYAFLEGDSGNVIEKPKYDGTKLFKSSKKLVFKEFYLMCVDDYHFYPVYDKNK